MKPRHELARAMPVLAANAASSLVVGGARALAREVLAQADMRMIGIALLCVIGASSEATAGPRSGGDPSRGGGRLAQVSSGIAAAASAGGGTRGGGTTAAARDWVIACAGDQYRRRVYDGLCVRRCPEGDLYRANDGVCVRRTVAVIDASGAVVETEAHSSPAPRQGLSRFTGYLGAQKVFESDGALTLELAVSDRWFRFSGSLTRFYEQQTNAGALTLTIPSLAFGVRIDDSNATRVYVEGGVVGALTRNDQMMDSSLHGVSGGVYAEHSLSQRTTLVGAAKLMAFEDDVRAASLRAGVRYRHVQASFSILDFNVGPALFGPEIGVGF